MHIAEQREIEGTALGMRGGLIKVAHAHQQTATAHAELKDQAETMVALDVVDDLHDGTVVRRQVVEHQRMRGLDDGKPLPVGMALGGKAVEKRMAGVGEDA